MRTSRQFADILSLAENPLWLCGRKNNVSLFLRKTISLLFLPSFFFIVEPVNPLSLWITDKTVLFHLNVLFFFPHKYYMPAFHRYVSISCSGRDNGSWKRTGRRFFSLLNFILKQYKN